MNLVYSFQDVDDYYSLRYAKLYYPGLVNLLFNKKVFLLSAGEGFLSSVVLFFIPYGAFNWGVSPWGEDVSDLQAFGVAVASILVVAVNLRVSMRSLTLCIWETSKWVLLSVRCLAADACLIADPGVASSIPAWSHTFVEIDCEIISTVILLSSIE